MWLAGRQRPDFRTLNRFCSQRMKTVLETVFTAAHGTSTAACP
ncbi:hypothetical protein NSS64_15025 [Paenibacillus sp. FSL H8-0122]